MARLWIVVEVSLGRRRPVAVAVPDDDGAAVLAMSPAMLLPVLVVLAAVPEIGRAHVRTPVTNAHLVCRLLLEKKTTDHPPPLPPKTQAKRGRRRNNWTRQTP